MSSGGSGSRAPRPRLAQILIVLGAISMVGATLSVYAKSTMFDSAEFGRLTAEAVAEPPVRNAVSSQLVDQLVALDPELLQLRPVLEVIIDGLLQTPVFAEMLKAAATDVHRTLFTDATDTVTLQLADLLLAARVSLAKLDPELAKSLPDTVTDGLVSVETEQILVDGFQLAENVGWLALLLPIVTMACFAAAVWVSGKARNTIQQIGVAIILVGVVVLAIEIVGRALFLRGFEAEAAEAAAAAGWDVFSSSAIDLAFLIIAAGVVLAALTVIGVSAVDLRRESTRLLDLLQPPPSGGRRLLWSAGAAATGLLLIFEWEKMTRIVLMVIGASLVVSAVVLVADVAGIRPPPERDDETAAQAGLNWRWVAGGVASIVLLAGVLVAIARSDGSGVATAAANPGCNGSVLLCERAVDEVAFPTTHNSMAAANDGFSFGYQTVGMLEQLDAGYRGFLIDAYFGLADPDGFVFTDRAPVTEDEREELVADVGEASVVAAEALREGRDSAGGTRDVYLCHSFCEVGAVRMADEMGRIKGWLDNHPREVLLFIIQDEGPKDADIEAAFAEAGMLDLLHAQPLDSPWPSLGEMIDSGKRVWVAAENNPGDRPWYHDAFTYSQDTLFSQPTTADFTCELHRGNPESPLFLINHWLSPASAVSADEANSRPVLEKRLADCEAEPRPFPNLIAVDFSDRGDTVEVVAEVNGIKP